MPDQFVRIAEYKKYYKYANREVIVKQNRFSKLLVIAFPMVLSQLADTIMLFTDRLMLSSLGPVHLAASMNGGLTSHTISAFFLGLVGYVNAIAAQHYGARQKNECGNAASQAIILSFVSYPLLLLMIIPVKELFRLMGQHPEQLVLSYEYFSTLMIGSIFFVLRSALSGFFLGIGRTKIVLLSSFLGMLVNIPANYIFIFGKFGAPAMGMKGAAYGTICGSAVILAILAAVYFSKKYREEFNTGRIVPDFAKLRAHLRFGLPAGFEMFLNLIAFNLFIQAMHSYGPVVAAATTITFNWDLVAFIPMIGLSGATTAITGQCIGAGDKKEAEKTAFTALMTAWVYSFTMTFVFVVFTPHLVSVFTSAYSAAEQAAVFPLALTMLKLAALYVIADSANLVFSGALKGAGDTRFAMLISTGLHLVFSSLALVLIYVVKADPLVIWACFIGFIILLGSCMYLRFRSGEWKKFAIIELSSKQKLPIEIVAPECVD